MIRRATAIAAVTWTELVRLKVFYFLIIFALLVIGNSFFLARFSFEEEFQMLKDIALGAMSVFSSLLAILATATLLPKDIEDRTIYTVLAKPVSRTEYLLGKLSGVFLLLTLAGLLMGAGFAAVLLLRTQTLLHSAQIEMAALPPAELQAALDKIRATGYDPNLLAGGVVILVKAWLLAALTMFISTFATATIFTTIRLSRLTSSGISKRPPANTGSLRTPPASSPSPFWPLSPSSFPTCRLSIWSTIS